MTVLTATLALATTFGPPTRWHVHSEVDLPAVMWMAAERNTEARMLQWQLDLVLACDPGDGARAVDVVCVVEDVVLAAAAHPADAGKLAGILEELDADLTGATVDLRVGPRGDVRGVGLRGLEVVARRSTATNENLRLMLSRAVAGFDLPVGDGVGEAWSQRAGWIAQLPAASGTLAGGRVTHEARDGVIASTGRVTLEPHGKYDGPPLGSRLVEKQETSLPVGAWDQWEGAIAIQGWFETEIRAVARLDQGALVARTWEAVGLPTPSARMALGTAGYPYRQAGSLRRLAAGEVVALGETREVALIGPAPTAIQTYETLGAVW